MFRLFNPLRRKPSKIRLQIISRDPFRVTMDEWRKSEECCRAAQLALANPTIRQMADILRTSHLANWALPPETSIEHRAIHAAKCEGYGLALNDFEALAVFVKPSEQIEATFSNANLELDTAVNE